MNDPRSDAILSTDANSEEGVYFTIANYRNRRSISQKESLGGEFLNYEVNGMTEDHLRSLT
jgi:hypothetical protein